MGKIVKVTCEMCGQDIEFNSRHAFATLPMGFNGPCEIRYPCSVCNDFSTITIKNTHTIGLLLPYLGVVHSPQVSVESSILDSPQVQEALRNLEEQLRRQVERVARHASEEQEQDLFDNPDESFFSNPPSYPTFRAFAIGEFRRWRDWRRNR